MGTRADAIATKLERAHDELLAAIENSTPQQWAAACTEGDWTQGFTAYHAAASIEGIAKMMQTLGRDGAPPAGTASSWTEIDRINADFHKEHIGCTRQEAIDLIRTSGPDAVATARGMSDDQLDRKVRLLAEMPELSVEQFAEMVLVGHVAGHLETITGAR